jgi:hypothetical protein
MAESTGGKKEKLWGPLRTPMGDSLGGEKVSGVPDAKSVPDPLGYVRGK